MIAAIGLAFCALVHASDEAPPRPTTPALERLGQVDSPALTELSGLAVSRRQPGQLWAINDSGNAASLVALSERLDVVGVVPVQDAYNHDWEDLSAFELDGRPWLLIADTGDNFSLRSEAALLLVPEPLPGARAVRTERVIRFRYEDGPRDCEAVAVDAPGRRVLLADKGRHPVGLYALALDGGPELRVARRIADFPELVPTPPPRVRTMSDLKYRGTPTAMSLSADGRRLAVLTYLSLSLFERSGDADWPAVLAHPPARVVRLPRVPLFEALALSADGRSAVAGTEGQPAPLYRWTP